MLTVQFGRCRQQICWSYPQLIKYSMHNTRGSAQIGGLRSANVPFLSAKRD